MDQAAKITTIDTSFEGVQRMLHQMARKGYGRMQAARIPIEYDDVFQQMCVGYVKARDKFDPSSGRRFTTYCQTACWNNFNKYFDVLMREHETIGHVSIEELKSHSGMEDSDADFLDAFVSDVADSPEDLFIRKRSIQDKAKSLSPDAKRVLYYFLNPTTAMQKEFESTEDAEVSAMSIAFIAEQCGMNKATGRLVKAELNKAFLSGQ